MTMLFDFRLLVFLAGVLLGYGVGRRVGGREGMNVGLAMAPLELRRRAWEDGACSICARAIEQATVDVTAEDQASGELLS